jgi:hypothetical protein
LPAVDVDALDEQARTRSILDLKDQKVNLVQAFAERKQTARLFASTMKRCVAAVTSLKRGKFGEAARALGVKASPRRIRKYSKSWSEDQSQAVANGWLELQYGWRPLLQDIYGSAELIAQKNIREVRSISSVSASKHYRDTMYKGGNSSNARYFFDIDRRVKIKYTVYYSTPSESHTLAQVGITNPAYIAWELTPWSFVVDWAIPIGNYINSLDGTKGLTFEKGCRTFFQKITVFGKAVSETRPDGITTYTFYDAGDYLKVECTRTAISSFPRTSLPSFKNPFGTEHVANLLALLRTSFTVRNGKFF